MLSAYQPRWPEISNRVDLARCGRPDELVPGLFVLGAGVVLHQLADQAALGVEHRQAAADLGREMEQVELGPEPAVVALLGLLEAVQVILEGGLGLPGRPVDALQLRPAARRPASRRRPPWSA